MPTFTKEELANKVRLAELRKEMDASDVMVWIDRTFIRPGVVEQNDNWGRGTREQHVEHYTLLGYTEMAPNMFARSFVGSDAPLGNEIIVVVLRHTN